ncbi:MAG: MFS transporter, partial [Alphaproteobacteria bacterium]|nr:MFS transporter [Alphaproteobacteria bacterium]
WMSESGLSLGTIGLSAMIGMPYILKFLWAPVLDRVAPPAGLARFGRRRGWLFAIQPLLVLSIAGFALSNPARAPLATVGAALLLAFLSASQDVVVDAWRIETFSPRQQGAAVARYVWGYRLALLAANAGAIKLASRIGWHGSLLLMALLGGAGLLATIAAPEPAVPAGATGSGGIRSGFAHAVVDPLREFLSRNGAVVILAFVVLFHLGDALAGVMLPPYYRALGYVRDDVALAYVPALLAALAGISAGGWLVARIGSGRALILTGFVQMAAILLYLALGYAGGLRGALVATVAAEAFVGGLASAAFLAFLSNLCAPAYTATQYALLSALAAVPLRTIGGLSGFLAAAVGWHAFFAFSTLAALPAMLLMLYLLRRYPARHAVPAAAAS